MTDFILHKKGYLPKENCQSLIDYFELNSDKHLDGVLGGQKRIDHSQKKSTELNFYLEDYDLPILQPLLDHLCKVTELYKKEYPFIDDLAKCGLYTAFKIQRYYPEEGYFIVHCENDGHFDGDIERRVIAWMVYLNDVFDGGYTSFPHQDKKFQPRTGDILMWPAYWTHPHQGIVSMTEKKYIITGWLSFLPDHPFYTSSVDG